MSTSKPLTIMLTAGGTGGHIFPALSVAEAFSLLGHSVVWLGCHHSMESRLVPEHKIPFHGMYFQGLRGKGIFAWLLLPFRLLLAITTALISIYRIRPAMLFGFGGYASFPPLCAAILLRIPFLLHEQNAIPGLSNRVMSIFARRVYSAFPTHLSKTIICGNPVRTSIEQLPPPQKRYQERTGPLRLLILGGSQGAKVLNQVIPEALGLLGAQERPIVTHQTGLQTEEETRTLYTLLKIPATVRPFLVDMSTAYGEADLVIGRAGAMTVSELSVAGVAALLIPFPSAVDDHQTANASVLVKAGGAISIPQKNFTPAWLADFLRGLNRDKCQEMGIASRQVAHIGTADFLATDCLELISS